MSGERFNNNYSEVEQDKTPEEMEGLKSIYHATLLNKWGDKIPNGDIVLDRNLFGWRKPDATFILGASSVQNLDENQVASLLNKGMVMKVIAAEDEIIHAPDDYIESGKTLRFVGIQGVYRWQSTYGEHEAPIVVFITDKAIEERKRKNAEKIQN